MHLTSFETTRLAECEIVIEEGISTFVDVGNALMEIRDNELYKTTHKRFEDYCRERWGMTRMHAGRMIAAAAVVGNVTHGLQIAPPKAERQARPLTKLPPREQATAWQEAVETAPEGKVTAAHVESVVAKRSPVPALKLTEEQKEHIKEAEEDSANLWSLKSTWRKTSKKDKKRFTEWIASNS